MFTIKLDDEFCFHIVDNDRGEWKIDPNSSAYCTTLEGFGGENLVSIFISTMQSGITSVHVVHQCVDSYINSVDGATRDYFNHEILGAYINRLIAENRKKLGLDYLEALPDATDL